MINKIVQSMADAMTGIKDGSTVLLAGFGSVGQPNALIDGLIEQALQVLRRRTREGGNQTATTGVVRVTGLGAADARG